MDRQRRRGWTDRDGEVGQTETERERKAQTERVGDGKQAFLSGSKSATVAPEICNALKSLSS